MSDNVDREQRIRERAYQIWRDEGMPDGRDKDHWQEAERRIKSGEDRTTSSPSDPPTAGAYEEFR